MFDWRGLACAFALLLAAPPTIFAADSPAPPLLLAERYRGGIDVADYWISEKLDGVRAVWDGRVLSVSAAAIRYRHRSGFSTDCPRKHSMANSGWGAGVLTNCPQSCAANCRSTPNGGACAT
jgi:hypothetical protein